MITVTIRTQPDALIKLFREDTDEVIYLDNADDNGLTAPLTLAATGHYWLEITPFPLPPTAVDPTF